MTSAKEVSRVIEGQLGKYFPKTSPYGQWYEQKTNSKGFATGAFCAMGMSWAFGQFSDGLDMFPLHAYTPNGVAWFKNRGLWHPGTAGIREGDIPYFLFPSNPSRVSHVGWARSKNSDGSVNTYEFNTSGTANGSQVNGRTNAARRRSSGLIVGYGRPNYGGATNSTPAAVGRPNCTAFQRAIRTPDDNVWGGNTDKNAWALRAASTYFGHQFPYGKAFTQGVVGVSKDNVWGSKSAAGHDRTVVQVQDALRSMGFDPGSSDGIWGDRSEGAFNAARNACHV